MKLKQPMCFLKKKCLQNQLHLQGPRSVRLQYIQGILKSEPERFETRWISRDDYSPEEWEEYFRKYRQTFNNYDMEIERQQAADAEHEAHQRSIEEWEAKVKAKELDNAALPCGSTPQGTSSMRVLPQVHEALRQNDPKMTSFSQPVVKKAPPYIGPSKAISLLF